MRAMLTNGSTNSLDCASARSTVLLPFKNSKTFTSLVAQSSSNYPCDVLATNCYLGKNWWLSPHGLMKRECLCILTVRAYGRALLFMGDPTPRLQHLPIPCMSPSTKGWGGLLGAFWLVQRILLRKRSFGKRVWEETCLA